jgi:hypothetical protein
MGYTHLGDQQRLSMLRLQLSTWGCEWPAWQGCARAHIQVLGHGMTPKLLLYPNPHLLVAPHQAAGAASAVLLDWPGASLGSGSPAGWY